MADQALTKACSICKIVKPHDEFHRIYRRGAARPHGRCKVCDTARHRTKRRNSTLFGVMTERIRSAKSRPCEDLVPMDIDAGFLMELFAQQGGLCHYTGWPMTLAPGPQTISLEKIVPGRGYTRGNVALVQWSVNWKKGDLTGEEFIAMCRAVAGRWPDEDQGSSLLAGYSGYSG